MTTKHNTIGKGSRHRAINGGEDAYYTSREKALSLTQTLSKVLPDIPFFAIVEPSAGDGAFVDSATTVFSREVQAFDISPRRADIVKADFFQTRIPQDSLVLGNPPFGFAANLAVRFFNHAAKSAKVIAFIVPRSFQKQSTQAKLDPWFHLEHEVLCEPDSFVLDGAPYSVPCVFQIWVKKDIQRESETLSTENPWIAFVPQYQATFSIRRVGGRAGEVLEGTDHNENTTYFCRETKRGAKNALRKCQPAFATLRDKTAGVRSISKREIHAVLQAHYANKGSA